MRESVEPVRWSRQPVFQTFRASPAQLPTTPVAYRTPVIFPALSPTGAMGRYTLVTLSVFQRPLGRAFDVSLRAQIQNSRKLPFVSSLLELDLLWLRTRRCQLASN